MAAKAANGEQNFFLNKSDEFVTVDEMKSTNSTFRNYLAAV